MTSKPTAPTTIDDYIAGFPPGVRRLLRQVRDTIRKTAPKAEEKISYQIPMFVLHGNLVHFGAFESHIGFYPTPTGLKEFEKELSKYAGAKGSVRFPLNQPMPLALITRIVTFRVRKNLERAASKK